MKSLVTIGEVSNRVDAMNQGCFDRLTDVSDISFISLQRMMVGDEEHTLRTVDLPPENWSRFCERDLA